jgi:hypothetical protein
MHPTLKSGSMFATSARLSTLSHRPFLFEHTLHSWYIALPAAWVTGCVPIVEGVETGVQLSERGE